MKEYGFRELYIRAVEKLRSQKISYDKWYQKHKITEAQIIAQKENSGALITGESVGQVASQTMPAIACTDAVCKMPVFRPLIGMDKDEVVAISRKIETFDISILPYEDCCTVFTPKHPKTRPTIDYVEECEKALEVDRLVDEAVKNTRFVLINAY